MNCPAQLSYVIRRGDTLYQLARRHQTTVAMILSLNPGLDPYNLQIGSAIAICPGENFPRPENLTRPENQTRPGPPSQMALINAMRLAWSQHVYWTRMVLISIAQRLQDQTDTVARLMRNPSDVADVFADYYPPDVTNVIAQLLTEHLQMGGDLITALRDGKTAEADDLNRRWYINADKMSASFSGINPYYSYEDLRLMFYTHLDLTKEEVSARLAGNYRADIDAFDKVEEEAMSMADYFSYGLMRNFPRDFL